MDFSLLGLWAQMGFVARAVVILLLIMSMYGVGFGLERFLTLQKARKRSLLYLAALRPVLEGRLEEAPRVQAEFSDAPLARIINVGLTEFRKGLDDMGAMVDSVELELLVNGVGRSMERAKKRELAALHKGLPTLATISSSAPFVGLFGTVFGIITAFQQMADPSKGGGGGLATVSAGIAEALLTTAVGLAVAIVAVWLFNYFTSRLDGFAAMADDATGELCDQLLHYRRGAQPARASGAPVAVPA